MTDKTIDEVKALTQTMVNKLTTTAKIPGIPVEIEGNTTMCRYKRVPNGYKLLIGTRTFLRTPYDLFHRLAHEVVHAINDMTYVDDVCGNGAYHTEEFKNTLALLNGTVEWGKGSGYATNLTIADNDYPNDENILPKDSVLIVARRSGGGKAGVNRSKIYKIVCPSCKQVHYFQKDEQVTQAKFDAQERRDEEIRARMAQLAESHGQESHQTEPEENPEPVAEPEFTPEPETEPEEDILS
jgi:hypothetical protein